MVKPADPDIKAEAIRLFNLGGWTAAALSRRLGVTSTTIRMWTDPSYAELRRRSVNQKRREAGNWGGGQKKSRSPSMPRVPM